MQPIYEDLIKMWKENGFDYEIYPGTFWLDNSIVKAYDKKGNLKYLYKVMIADDLSVTFKKHSNCPDYTDFNFETWEETAKRIKPVFLIYPFCTRNTSLSVSCTILPLAHFTHLIRHLPY